MSSPLIRLVIAAATISLVALAGCTSANVNIAESGSRGLDVEVGTGGSDGDTYVMSESQAVVEFDVQDEKVLVQNSHLSESLDTSPFTSKTGRVAFYSDCIGPGRLTISLGAGTETSRECRTSTKDAVHRDDLVIDASGRYSVSISMTNEQPWAVTVTELPPEVSE